MNTPDTANTDEAILDFKAMDRMDKDIKAAADLMGRDQVRYLVSQYYNRQEGRIRSAAQLAKLEEREAGNSVLEWAFNNERALENQIRLALGRWAKLQHMGVWAMSHVGIGPVLAAGILAHIDIHQAPTVGHIWRFAGLDPTLKWERGEKRPFNADLKVLCWKIGESFVKQSGREECFYGQLYQARRKEYGEKNEAGVYSDAAKAVLDRAPGHKQKAIYAEGKLSPGHLHSRAKRWAVKLFLAHWHGEAFRHAFGKEPPLPYPIAHMGHTHVINPPNTQ